MKARVPSSSVDNQYELFPAGTFRGNLAGAERTEMNDDGSRIGLRVSAADTAPLSEADPETNGRTFTDRLPIVWDGQSIVEVDDFRDQNVPYPLRDAAAKLAGLGEALGLGERVDGDVVVDFGQILEVVQSGDVEGTPLIFEVEHRSYTINEGTDAEEERTTDQFARIAPAE